MPGGRARMALTAALLALAAGCGGADFRRAVLADRNPAAHRTDLSAQYAVYCPDVLEIEVDGPEPLHFERTVGPDGRVDVADLPLPRLEGMTTRQIARAVAAALRLRPEQVRVRVSRYESQQLFLN